MLQTANKHTIKRSVEQQERWIAKHKQKIHHETHRLDNQLIFIIQHNMAICKTSSNCRCFQRLFEVDCPCEFVCCRVSCCLRGICFSSIFALLSASIHSSGFNNRSFSNGRQHQR